jgi:hypothetical protein
VVSRIRTLAGLHDRLKSDTDNTIAALRLQAKAWRICALLGLVDSNRGAKLAQWLFFQTIPWVNAEALEKFIKENFDAAEVAGRSAGVFTSTKEDLVS